MLVLIPDTTVVGELARPAPERGAAAWASAQLVESVTTMAPTQTQVRPPEDHAAAPAGRRRRHLAVTAGHVAALTDEVVARHDGGALATTGPAVSAVSALRAPGDLLTQPGPPAW